MFKKLINDERSIEWNILMYTLILFAIYFVIATPIVLIGLHLHPEMSDTLTEQPKGDAQFGENLKSIAAVDEFIILGTILEFLRRKRSMKFKIVDTQANKFLLYFSIEMFLFNVLYFAGSVLSR